MPREAHFDLSRYKFSDVAQDSGGYAYLEDREPFGYTDRDDNILHVVKDGDTLASLAQYYYWYLHEAAAELWWVIADFQPAPVINPFRPLVPGKLVVIPAPEFVASEILSRKVGVIQ